MLFLVFKSIAISFPLLFAIAFKIEKEGQLDGEQYKKEAINQCTKRYKIKSDNFCYRKIGRAITKWGVIEKSPILLSQYWKIILYFGGTNKFFSLMKIANFGKLNCEVGNAKQVFFCKQDSREYILQ